jgi:hypothetical protein
LEDTLDVAQFLKTVRCGGIFGADAYSDGSLRYTENSQRWFDLSLISAYGKLKADKLNFKIDRRIKSSSLTVGFRFGGESCLLPDLLEIGLSGDVAIASDSGVIWPMKRWAY